MLNLAHILEFNLGRNPDNLAIIFNDRKMTYRELNGAATKFADGLRQLGINPGDKVALMMPNVPYFPIAYYGILKAGATVVPFNVLFKGREVAYHLKDSDAVALVGFEMFTQPAYEGFQAVDSCKNLIIATADPMGPLPVTGDGIKHFSHVIASGSPTFDTVQTMPDDTAVILYTSGTTGQPKGVVQTHGAALRAFESWASVVGLRSTDRYLIINPFFHAFGYKAGIVASLVAGSTMVPMTTFDVPAAMRLVAAERISVLPGPPAIYQTILNHPNLESFDMSSLRLAVTGAAAVPVEMIHQMRDKLGFEVIVTHDAEDLIHPDSLRWINHYMQEYDMVQVPVLPLPTPGRRLTHGVYCDEFAEFTTLRDH